MNFQLPLRLFPTELLNIFFKRETRAPVLALLFASAAVALLVVGRMGVAGRITGVFWLWNLGLAWLPLIFALLAHEQAQRGGARGWKFFALAAAWLLFFPNAPYIFTDVVHLMHDHREYFWVELSMVLLCALTGLVLGFVSLYLMQSLVAARVGTAWSWVFVAFVAAAGSFGIYLGRFLRFNSWDVVLRPGRLVEQVGGLLADPLAQPLTVAFATLYAVFIFVAYVMLYGLTRLPQTAPRLSAELGVIACRNE